MKKAISNDLSSKSFEEVMNEWLTHPVSDLLSMFPREKKDVEL